MPKARIRLSSTDVKLLDEVCEHIKEISKKTGVSIKGPIPLPTHRLKIPTRKCPCGAGREIYETWELRIHKRLIDLGADERALRMIMKTSIPTKVNVEMEIVE